jgi:hypothetical protein
MKMARQLAAGLCLLIALGMVGCSGEDVGIPPSQGGAGAAAERTTVGSAAVPPTARYMPLQAGNWWKYRKSEWTKTSGNVVSTYTRKIKGIETLEGKRWYRSLYVSASGQATDSDWYRHIASGLWSRDTYYYKDWLFLKAPVESGSQWDRRPGYDSVIQGKDLTVTVPAGTFTNCVLVRTSCLLDPANGVELGEWYAPDVGVVKATYKQIWWPGHPEQQLQYSRTERLLQTNVVPAG